MRAIRAVQHAKPTLLKTGTVKFDGRGEDGKRVEKYVPHDEAWTELEKLCHEYGLTVTQDGTPGANGSQWMTTRITWTSEDGEHEQWKEGDVLVASPRPGFRDFGAFWSYVRRIALLAAFGIVPEGDEPDQREADRVAREVAPPRANKGARPAGAPRDPEAEAQRVLSALRELPAGTTKAQVDGLAQQLRGVTFTPATHEEIKSAFESERKRLRLA